MLIKTAYLAKGKIRQAPANSTIFKRSRHGDIVISQILKTLVVHKGGLALVKDCESGRVPIKAGYIVSLRRIGFAHPDRARANGNVQNLAAACARTCIRAFGHKTGQEETH